MPRFFPRKPRFALAALVIGLGISLVFMGLSRTFGRKPAAPGPSPVARRANPDSPRYLGTFVRLPATPVLMAPIHSASTGGRSSLGSYSSAQGSTLHNFVFLNVETQSFRRLIPTNDYGVEELDRLPEPHAATPSGAANADCRDEVRWLLFDVIKLDTDRDGDLDGEDLHTLAVSDAGGAGYAELIGGIRAYYGRTLRDPDTLVVVYESGGAKRVSLIDLPKRAVTSTTLLPDLGADVK